MPIRLTVFDVAGTTVLDNDTVVDSMQSALAPTVSVVRGAIKAVMGMPKPEAIRRLLRTHTACSDHEIDGLTAKIHPVFVNLVLDRCRSDPMVRPVPDAADVFRRLHRAGIRVALGTGFSRDILDVLLVRFGWDQDLVDVTVTSDEVVQGRPQPHLIYRAMQLTGIADAGEVAKIGDTPADIEEGRAAGCGLIVGVTYGSHSRLELSRYDVPLIDRVADLLPLVGAA